MNATNLGAGDDSRPLPANDTHIGLVVSEAAPRLRNLRTVPMRLEGVAKSTEALAVVALLNDTIGTTAKGRGTSNLKPAIAAIIYDALSAAAHDPVRPLYRPMGNGDFKGQRVTYWPARAAIEAFEKRGLLTRSGGNIDRESVDGKGTKTRFWPTVDLLDELANHGLTPANRRTHFDRVANRRANLPPILLNTAKVRKGKHMPKGKPLPVDYSHPRVAAMAAQVARINDFTAKAVIEIEGAEFVGFQRAFNLGDHPSFDWNKGGRLWDLQGQFQFVDSDERQSITINGEPTCEIDIGSSHLTIFLTLIGIPFDPTIDLYDIPGFDRQVIKRYVNLTLSERRIPTKWPSSMRAKFLKKFKRAIDADHSIDAIKEQCLLKYPVLRQRRSIDLDWSDLQFIESEATIEAVDALNQDHGIVALPIHDSIRVAQSHKAVAVGVLSDAFHRHVGVYPIVK